MSHACKRAGVARATVYEAKENDAAFRAAWNDALDCACDAMEAEAYRRAVEGVARPVYHAGKLVGKVKEYSDTLLIFMLKAHRPEKFRENFRAEHWDIDLTQLTDQQLDAVIAGKTLAQVLAVGNTAVERHG